jgi:SAM-dependent methyltransferase
MSSPESLDLSKYPEHPLETRVKRAMGWLPSNLDSLLDAGCSYGYSTCYFRQIAKHVTGIEIDPEAVRVAKLRYPDIDFRECDIETTPFADQSFECITLLDSLEHVSNDVKALNEMDRLLKPDGYLVISTPHPGLFGWLDPVNFGYNLLTYWPKLYRALFSVINRIKGTGSSEASVNPYHLIQHRHYSIAKFREILDKSTLSGRYRIEHVARTGLVIEPVAFTIDAFLKSFLGEKKVATLSAPFIWLSKVEYWIPTGPLGFDIMILVRKTSERRQRETI